MAAASHTVVLTLTGDDALADRLQKKLGKAAAVEHQPTPPTGRIVITLTERAGGPQAAADAAVARVANADDTATGILYAVDPAR